MSLIDCQGLRYTGTPHRAGQPGLEPPPPYDPCAKPGKPSEPPIRCLIDATVFAPLPAGAPAFLGFHYVSYPVTSPWALRFEVPAGRPAIWSGPVACQVAGIEVRLEEAFLSSQGTILFLTTGVLKMDGLIVNGSIVSPSLVDSEGRLYPSSGGGGSPTSSQWSNPPVPAGQTELTLTGRSIILNVNADGRALGFDLPA